MDHPSVSGEGGGSGWLCGRLVARRDLKVRVSSPAHSSSRVAGYS